MERLSADDTRILRLESDAIAGHTLKLAIVEPAPDGQPLTVERVRNRVEARLGNLPRARQRLAPTPLRLAAPAWVDDSEFDIRNHVRPAPHEVSDRAQLMRLVGAAMAERLDHTRPLWSIGVAGPLSDGRTALVIRIHHCLADGVTCLRMLSQLLVGLRGRRRAARLAGVASRAGPRQGAPARLRRGQPAAQRRRRAGERRPRGGLPAPLAPERP